MYFVYFQNIVFVFKYIFFSHSILYFYFKYFFMYLCPSLLITRLLCFSIPIYRAGMWSRSKSRCGCCRDAGRSGQSCSRNSSHDLTQGEGWGHHSPQEERQLCSTWQGEPIKICNNKSDCVYYYIEQMKMSDTTRCLCWVAKGCW